MAQNGVKHFIFEIIAVASAGSVNDVASIYHLIHSLLGDSYGCVNHAFGRLTHLAELNISHVPCVQGDFRAVYSGSCSTNCVGSVPPTCVYIGRVLQPTKNPIHPAFPEALRLYVGC